jgi:hypothetical protein
VTAAADPVTYVTVADSKFFLGVVALVNSLRLTGNTEPIVVIDAGLSEEQVRRLSEVCEVRSPATNREGELPAFIKPAVCAMGFPGTTVLLDSDIIVTSRLTPISEQAAAGKFCIFIDTESRRVFEEWREPLALTAPYRSQPYVNSGFAVFQASAWQDVMERWTELSARVSGERSKLPHRLDDDVARKHPFAYVDQDVLNALLMTEVDESRLHLLNPDLAGLTDWYVKIDDASRLRCSRRSQPMILLHFTGSPKPWLLQARHRIVGEDYQYFDAYEGLLGRLLTSPDLPIRLPADAVPLWLRHGAVGTAARRGPRLVRKAALAGLGLLPASVQRRATAAGQALASAAQTGLAGRGPV